MAIRWMPRSAPCSTRPCRDPAPLPSGSKRRVSSRGRLVAATRRTSRPAGVRGRVRPSACVAATCARRRLARARATDLAAGAIRTTTAAATRKRTGGLKPPNATIGRFRLATISMRCSRTIWDSSSSNLATLVVRSRTFSAQESCLGHHKLALEHARSALDISRQDDGSGAFDNTGYRARRSGQVDTLQGSGPGISLTRVVAGEAAPRSPTSRRLDRSAARSPGAAWPAQSAHDQQAAQETAVTRAIP